jgi:energy-coupling factor transport system substrate-specific component
LQNLPAEIAGIFQAPQLGFIGAADRIGFMQNDESKVGEAVKSDDKFLALAMIPVGIVINLSIGTLVSILKLPLFVDATGTILVTLLIGIRAGVITGILSFLIGGLLVNPVMPWFCGTQAAIAVYIGLMARVGFFRSFWRVILSGIGLGIVAAAVSAPVIVKLFGGITGNGSALITAFFLATGKSIVKSVFLTGISCEPIDKTLQCLLAFWLIRSLPKKLLGRFGKGGHLGKNDFYS